MFTEKRAHEISLDAERFTLGGNTTLEHYRRDSRDNPIDVQAEINENPQSLRQSRGLKSRS